MFKKLHSPKFWNSKDHILGKVLSPLSFVYYFFTKVRSNSVSPNKVEVPVVSINSVMLSGAGKTPTVALVYDILVKHGLTPHILTRGYSGYIKNVIRVDPKMHSYLQVGDESLVSAQVAPTWIGRNHFKSANAAIFSGTDILIVDSGLYCKTLVCNFNILVIDANQQFGNERLFPAGPLIERIEIGIKTADAILIIGQKSEMLETRIKTIHDIPICYASLRALIPPVMSNNRVLGFCGLGYPQKFRQTLVDCNYNVIDFIVFPDHHPYTITEIQRLIEKSKSVNATLVTTLKDYVKIPEVFREEIKVIPINVVPEDNSFEELLVTMIGQSHSDNKNG